MLNKSSVGKIPKNNAHTASLNGETLATAGMKIESGKVARVKLKMPPTQLSGEQVFKVLHYL
jgi:hypothetical protein